MNITEKTIRVFRAIAGTDIHECAKLDNPEYAELDKSLSDSGTNVNLTLRYLMDALEIMSAKDGDYRIISDGGEKFVRNFLKRNCVRVSDEDRFAEVFGDSAKGEPVEEEKEVFEEPEEPEEPVEEVVEEPEEEIEEPEEEDEDLTVGKEDILKYYEYHCNAVVSELLKRYTGLFASGYEVTRPAGILTDEGLLTLSGNKAYIKENSVATTQIYSIFNGSFRMDVSDARAVSAVAKDIVEGYTEGSQCLYFPYKMLEFTYGRKTARGDNANSKNTYEKHAEAGSWSRYSNGDLKKSLLRLTQGCLVWYIENVTGYEEAKKPEAIEKVAAFLSYLQKCMSMCILMIDYKVVGGNPSTFKVRVCDPENRLGFSDYTPVIIKRAFMGGTGAVPFSLKPRFEEESYVKEYAHEFNHNISQAMPLFAYKAFESLKEQGIDPTWDNMILGLFEDGSVLKNGTHGVAMKNNLTHQLDAGSRAGKGVMTLNFLASAIYSRKNIFYLDRKPDMASMFKHLSPNMFVVNGATWSDDDRYNEFTWESTWKDSSRVPVEVTEILGCGYSWLELGDLYYMRALKLIMGIIMARGDGRYTDEKFGGSDGILLVADEFKNFQENYAIIIGKMLDNLPGDGKLFDSKKVKYEAMLESAGDKPEKIAAANVAKSQFDDAYNNRTFYALSYMNHMIADLEFLSSKRDAGFASIENELSDVFVIGQHIEHGAVEYEEYRDACTSGRYRQDGRYGLPKDIKSKLDTIHQSFGYSLVSFKNCDAFFGRNQEDGREVYLAQLDKNSKAYGRLDDKASNFAYLRKFSDDVRKKIVEDRGNDNLNIASQCIYFKPFLVLNDDSDRYVQPMYNRCAGDEAVPWVTPEQIISDNPDSSDPTMLNRAVGFENYLRMMGVNDYAQILEKGVNIVNHVIHDCLGYSGTWMEFITDLRPEWMFTVEDIVMGARGNATKLSDPSRNPVLSEYYHFDSSLGSGVSTTQQETPTSDYFSSMDGEGEPVDFAVQEAESSLKLQTALGDMDELGEDEVISFDDDEEDMGYSIQEDPNDLNKEVKESQDNDMEKALEHIEALRDMGIDLEIGENGWVAVDPRTHEVRENGFESAPMSEFGKELDRIDYSDEITSYAQLVQIVTDDVLKKFGGIERVFSLKVVGGSIIVNGYYYRCNVKDLYAKNIPYDIKREMSGGNISKLFDYSRILAMPSVSDLEFDSTQFTYDYVSSAMGFGNSISVDKFFKNIRTLQVLTIGKRRFTRENYMKESEGDDLFRHASRARTYADTVQNVAFNAGKKSFGWSKNVWCNKRNSLWKRALLSGGGAVVAAGAVTTGAGVAVAKRVPGVVSGFIRGAKDLLK